ncbi:hypothetical protein ABID19_005928 [Mesorhizobium robiniae]|uniref:Uncharacterized protein n=1 Tax=Mesorhizobium robiniae TaxID=559315 RepID=A0ABV2GX51_9HYPH
MTEVADPKFVSRSQIKPLKRNALSIHSMDEKHRNNRFYQFCRSLHKKVAYEDSYEQAPAMVVDVSVASEENFLM